MATITDPEQMNDADLLGGDDDRHDFAEDVQQMEDKLIQSIYEDGGGADGGDDNENDKGGKDVITLLDINIIQGDTNGSTVQPVKKVEIRNNEVEFFK